MRRNQRLGRAIGVIGGVLASLVWGVVLLATAAFLMNPPAGLAALGVIVAMPITIFASLLFVVAAADVVMLVKRVDGGMLWRVGAAHVVMALLVLAFGHVHPRAWLGAGVMLAIAATQFIALWLFAQITPSHASSQR